MNVNPFSYLIEKLKSKADKADLANYLKIDLTTYGTQTNYVHDFNDITTTGNYWCYCKYSDTQNQPAGVGTPNGVLMVTGTSDGITQLYIDRTNSRIYSRTYRASWSAWNTLALTSDLIKTMSFSGTSNSSGYFSVTLPSASCKVVGLECSLYCVWYHDPGTKYVYVSLENFSGTKLASEYASGTLFYID